MNQLPSNPQTPGSDQVSRGSGRKITPLLSWRRHALKGIAVFVAIVILGIPVILKKGKLVYQAEGVVLVSPRFLKNLEDDKEFDLQSNTQYREFVQQNVRTVDRYDIIEEVVNRLGETKYPWRHAGEAMPRAVARLRGALTISPVPDTYQITIRVEGDKAAGLAETVNTVIDVYLEKAKDEEFYDHDRRVASLREDANRLSEVIAAEAKEKNELAQQLGVSAFGESLVSPFDRLLVESKEALAIARQKRIVAESDLIAIEARQGNGGDSAIHAYGEDQAQKNPALMTLQANLNVRRTELMAKLAGMLPTHPGRAQMEKEIRDIDQVLNGKGEILADKYSSLLLTQRRAEVKAAVRAEQQLQMEVDEQAKRAAWYSGNYQKALYISLEMERARKRLESIDDRLNFILLESRAPGFARLFSPARTPVDPLRGGRKKLFLIVLLAGTLLGLATPLVIDMLDPRILSPNEAENLIGFPPLGFTYAGREGRMVESRDRVRRIAAAIERESLRNESRSFLFVPVNNAVNLAGLLQDLSIELEHLGNSVRVIGSEGTQTSARSAAAAAGAGSDMRGASQDAASSFGSVRRMMSQTVSESEFALVATPPLSDRADTELLASTCDVVVLTLEAAATTKAEFKAATKTLERIQPKAVAVMVTGYEPDPPAPPPLVAQIRAMRHSTPMKGEAL
jgi:capsular polysaccharide biosynthesis protein